MIHNLKSFKLAKQYEADLLMIVEQLEKDILKYNKHKKYKPVLRVLSAMTEELAACKKHLINCAVIKKSKGQINET